MLCVGIVPDIQKAVAPSQRLRRSSLKRCRIVPVKVLVPLAENGLNTKSGSEVVIVEEIDNVDNDASMN